jgi:HEAT repeat protein
MLGDHEWLSKQKPATAVNGLTARLKAITAGGAPRPLDYAPLEAWLTKNPKGRSLVEKELAPGSCFVDIQKSDVDEAVRALSSPFAVVRWHAADVLGERELGAAAGAKALPALASVLRDKHALVRRLAVLSITRWKAASKPYHAAIRAMKKDSDPVVRDVAAKI